MSKRGHSGWTFFKKRRNLFVLLLCPRLGFFFTVISTCCGPALTDFKYEFIMKARQLSLSKRRQKRLSVAPAVVPLWLISNLEFNMKARQLLFFKAEVKEIVSSSCCGPALTYFKKWDQNEGSTISNFLKWQQSRQSAAPNAGLLWLISNRLSKWRPNKCNLTKRWHSGKAMAQYRLLCVRFNFS
jgi:hypothetical protein